MRNLQFERQTPLHQNFRMKKQLFLLPLIACFAAISHAQQPALMQGDVAIKSIMPAGVKTPDFQIANGAAKRSRGLTWLEVEVDYSTKVDIIDELTFEYQILIGTQSSAMQLLTGSTTYVNIEKGLEHYAVVYVSPQAIAGILGRSPFNASAIQNIQVRITRQGQEIARKVLKGTQIPNLPQKAGLVLNKADTPFAPLYWDRYEAVKPAAR